MPSPPAQSNKGSTIDGSWYQRPPGVPEQIAAGGVIIGRRRHKIHVAVLRRPGGMVQLPKGKVERGESLEEAARREIKEETGFAKLLLLTDLGSSERLDYRKEFWKKTRYFLFMVNESAKANDGVRWVEIEKLPAFFWPDQRIVTEKAKTYLDRLARA